MNVQPVTLSSHERTSLAYFCSNKLNRPEVRVGMHKNIHLLENYNQQLCVQTVSRGRHVWWRMHRQSARTCPQWGERWAGLHNSRPAASLTQLELTMCSCSHQWCASRLAQHAWHSRALDYSDYTTSQVNNHSHITVRGSLHLGTSSLGPGGWLREVLPR